MKKSTSTVAPSRPAKPFLRAVTTISKKVRYINPSIVKIVDPSGVGCVVTFISDNNNDYIEVLHTIEELQEILK